MEREEESIEREEESEEFVTVTNSTTSNFYDDQEARDANPNNNAELCQLLSLGAEAELACRSEEALDLFERARASFPDSSEAHMRLAWCNEELGDFEEALVGYDEAIRLAPNKEYVLNL